MPHFDTGILFVLGLFVAYGSFPIARKISNGLA
jgi:hypothetical protein